MQAYRGRGSASRAADALLAVSVAGRPDVVSAQSPFAMASPVAPLDVARSLHASPRGVRPQERAIRCVRAQLDAGLSTFSCTTSTAASVANAMPGRQGEWSSCDGTKSRSGACTNLRAIVVQQYRRLYTGGALGSATLAGRVGRT